MNPKKTTMAQIAEAAGVHRSTVSRVLQGRSRISSAMIFKIRQLADRLNYSQDPVSFALSSYRKSKKQKPPIRRLAWLDYWPGKPSYLQTFRLYPRYFHHCGLQAKKRGYELVPLWLKEEGMTREKALKTLFEQDVRGLILAPQPRSHGHIHFSWEHFSVVSISNTLVYPRFHVIARNQYRDLWTVFGEIEKAGYERWGYVTAHSFSRWDNRSQSAAFLAAQFRLSRRNRIPILFKNDDEGDFQLFSKWFTRYQPDVVMGSDNRLHEWMLRLGARIPRDVGFASLSLPEGERGFSGLIRLPRLIGENAVDWLIALIQRNERGIPADPRALVVEGRWVPGNTL